MAFRNNKIVTIEFSAEIVVSDIPDDYWVAVPSRSFLSVDLSVNIIEDDRDRIRAVHETQPVGNVTIQTRMLLIIVPLIVVPMLILAIVGFLAASGEAAKTSVRYLKQRENDLRTIAENLPILIVG